MKKAVIIHGWGGTPQYNWFQWLKKELQTQGFKVEIPQMPNTEAPEITHWVKELTKHVNPDDENYLIGHSMGCQAIMRYLEKAPKKIKKAVLVAGFITSLSDEIMKNPEEKQIALPWLETKINLAKVKKNAEKIISLVSDDDPLIPEDNWKEFKKLGTLKIYHERGHFQRREELDILDVINT